MCMLLLQCVCACMYACACLRTCAYSYVHSLQQLSIEFVYAAKTECDNSFSFTVEPHLVQKQTY